MIFNLYMRQSNFIDLIAHIVYQKMIEIKLSKFILYLKKSKSAKRGCETQKQIVALNKSPSEYVVSIHHSSVPKPSIAIKILLNKMKSK